MTLRSPRATPGDCRRRRTLTPHRPRQCPVARDINRILEQQTVGVEREGGAAQVDAVDTDDRLEAVLCTAGDDGSDVVERRWPFGMVDEHTRRAGFSDCRERDSPVPRPATSASTDRATAGSAVSSAIFLRGENPDVYGGSESDASYTIHRRLQAGYSTLIHTIN